VDSSPVARELAAGVAATVDAAAGGRVIVLGSLPPSGRDLDLVALAPERERIERALVEAGLARKGAGFALFRSCSAYGVELFAAEDFAPAAALAELFAQAIPLPGFDAFARPSPPHALLVLAMLVADEGRLEPKRRERLMRILAEDPHAWEHAGESASVWHAQRELSQLERAASGGGPVALPPARLRARASRVLRSPHRGLLVALSGIDGSGKSSQSRWLADALTALGCEVEVVWNDLLGNRALDLLAAPPKALLRFAGRKGERIASYDEAPPRSPDEEAGALHDAWSTIVTIANALEQRIACTGRVRHGHVVVFDRSPLDLAVRMEVLYRTSVGLQRRLVELAAPRPDLAFLLDIPAEVSLARKSDIWSRSQLLEQAMLYRTLAPRFGVRPLDGQRPPDEIAAEIARAAWLALP
jgi:thymidylate kinase